MGKAGNDPPFGFIPTLTGYGVSLEEAAADEAGEIRVASSDEEGDVPQITLKAVDEEVVGFIERKYRESESYEGAKFTLEPWCGEIPWHGPSQELVIAETQRARRIHNVLSEFYNLLKTGKYWASQYSVRIEAARHALFTVYPYFFQDVPPISAPQLEGESELEARRRITKQVWPAAERFNGVVDKIAEIVSGNGYRSKIAREKAKLKQRAKSVTTLIDGLLDHHESLAVVAVRLSIRQDKGRDFIGDEMHKALRSIIGDRRNDSILSQAVGYFWVLQESFRVINKRRSPKSNKVPAVDGKIALHYDLVMFFDAIHIPETEAIQKHIGACWSAFAGKAGFYRRLIGTEFVPHFLPEVSRHRNETQQFPPWAEISGLVKKGTKRASLLKAYAMYMVASASLRKPKKPEGTLIKSNTRRFGKSDLLTGCGFDKAGRGNKLGPSSVKHERKKRPKYVPPKF